MHWDADYVAAYEADTDLIRIWKIKTSLIGGGDIVLKGHRRVLAQPAAWDPGQAIEIEPGYMPGGCSGDGKLGYHQILDRLRPWLFPRGALERARQRHDDAKGCRIGQFFFVTTQRFSATSSD